jgi:AraC family transcriptional regulator
MPRYRDEEQALIDENREASLAVILSGLLNTAGQKFDTNPLVARDCIHQASEVLTANDEIVAGSYRDGRPERHSFAAWQAKRVQAYIDENIARPILVGDLAAFTRLSPSYFFRAFKGSFGTPPHAYIIRRRMAHARLMLSGTDEPLGQIALACGLADQAHFSRLFRRTAGVSPGVWRRALRGATTHGVRASDLER